MTSKFLIYGLFDPRNGQLRYIGKSSGGLRRPVTHGIASVLDKEKTHKANWIRSLRRGGYNYEIDILEEFPRTEDLPDAEKFWINYFRSIGANLTNTRNGGGGGPAKPPKPKLPKAPKPEKVYVEGSRVRCPDCDKRKWVLDRNKSCKKCNRMRGLKQCPRCKDLLPIDLEFYTDQSACAKCRKLARQASS